MAEDAVRRRALLVGQGWEQQGSFDEPRLSDVVEMYREIGCEVLLEPYDPVDDLGGGGCSACMVAAKERFRTIFTRKIA
jgi:hypothetical protein